MKTQQLLTIAASGMIATASAAVAAIPQYGNSIHQRRGDSLLPAGAPRHLSGRAGSGPAGFLTVDDTDYSGAAAAGAQFATASSEQTSDADVFSSKKVDGAYTSCLPVFTGATTEDCQAVLGDIRGSGNGTVSVAGGLCMNWWEGTCLARVCAREPDSVYTQQAGWIADALEETALDVCVAKDQAGVVADCAEHANPCGTYRFWLQASQPGH